MKPWTERKFAAHAGIALMLLLGPIDLALAADSSTFAQSRRALEQSQPAKALQELTSLFAMGNLRKDQTALALYLRGKALLALKQPARAIGDFKSALWLKLLPPNLHADAQRQLSSAYLAIGVANSKGAGSLTAQAQKGNSRDQAAGSNTDARTTKTTSILDLPSQWHPDGLALRETPLTRNRSTRSEGAATHSVGRSWPASVATSLPPRRPSIVTKPATARPAQPLAWSPTAVHVTSARRPVIARGVQPPNTVNAYRPAPKVTAQTLSTRPVPRAIVARRQVPGRPVAMITTGSIARKPRSHQSGATPNRALAVFGPAEMNGPARPTNQRSTPRHPATKQTNPKQTNPKQASLKVVPFPDVDAKPPMEPVPDTENKLEASDEPLDELPSGGFGDMLDGLFSTSSANSPELIAANGLQRRRAQMIKEHNRRLREQGVQEPGY